MVQYQPGVFASCRNVTVNCPVEATTLGYYPNLGVNIFLAIAFGICALPALFVGLWKRTWAYSLAVGLACGLECAGYIGRVLMHYNPWDIPAFELQIVLIILSPTIACFAMYLTLKHICLAINPSLSRLQPRRYPYIFVPLDICCLLFQAVGGALAAAAQATSMTLLNNGNRLILTGICLQVVVLGAFGSLVLDYAVRMRKWLRSADTVENKSESTLLQDKRFEAFAFTMVIAYGAILIRCIYRIAEMAGGWGNPIMQDEPSFIALESFMILIGFACMALSPPGLLFPQMSNGEKSQKATDKKAEMTLIQQY